MPEFHALLVSSAFFLAFTPGGMAQATQEHAQRLFLTNCASCHGESGDGQGTAELDRPARSFQDGGFSFGNTPEALFRTISVGIPGTPMAGFDSSLSEEEREVLAAYVVTLGPPIEEVKVEDTILSVRDTPLVVRGLLPSLGEGLPSHPRGLLIGDPSGITFEYRADDVRLLALRQGGFVRRTDWTGRGGTPLEPLGKVVQLVEGGNPGALFHRQGAGLTPLAARLRATAVQGPCVRIEYQLVDHELVDLVDHERAVARVVETPSVLRTQFGTGYSRHFDLTGGSRATELWIQTPGFGGGKDVHTATGPKALWGVSRRAEGGAVWVALRFSRQPMQQDHGQGVLSFPLQLEAGEHLELEYSSLVLTEWNDNVRRYLEDLLDR